MGCKKYQKGGKVPEKSFWDEFLSNILDARALEGKLGEGAHGAIFGAREGKPERVSQVEGILGKEDIPQNELAMKSRYIQGKNLAESVPLIGTPLATAANVVYTGDKALSQALGRDRRMLPITDVGQFGTPEKFGPTTSDASLGNFLAAQQGIFDQSSLGRFANSLIDRAGFQKGGAVNGANMPAKYAFRMPTKDLIQNYQTGGLVEQLVNQIRGVNVDTGDIGGYAKQLGDIGTQFSNFDPFGGGLGGTAQNTLQTMLSTGAPTDVDPIAEAAQSRAGQLYSDLTGNVNESMGALGLGSSSSRARALTRGASDLSAQVGQTAMRAGVGAQEAAKNRQMGAFNPFLGANQQRLGALGGAGQAFSGAGGLSGQKAGIDLQAQLGPLDPFSNVVGNLFGGMGHQMNQPPAQGGGGGSFNPMGGGGVFGPGGGNNIFKSPHMQGGGAVRTTGGYGSGAFSGSSLRDLEAGVATPYLPAAERQATIQHMRANPQLNIDPGANQNLQMPGIPGGGGLGGIGGRAPSRTQGVPTGPFPLGPPLGQPPSQPLTASQPDPFSQPQGSVFGGFQGGGSIGGSRTGGFQSSGGREDYGDFLSKLLFDRQFTRRQPQQQFQPQPQYRPQRRPSSFSFQPQRPQGPRGSGLGGAGAGRPGSSGGPFTAPPTGAEWRNASDPTRLDMPGAFRDIAKVNQWFGPQLVSQMMMQKGKNWADVIGAGSGSSALGAAAQQTDPRTIALQMGINPWQRGQEGGVVQGPSVPPDQVPIMAQGGEGVIPVGQMHDLEQSESQDPLINNLQDTMGFQEGGMVGPFEHFQSLGGPSGLSPEEQTQVFQSYIQERLNQQQPEPMGPPPPESSIAMGPPGDFPQGPGFSKDVGVDPLSEGERFEKAAQDAQRRIDLLRSAMITGTKGSAEGLAPYLSSAQGELQDAVGNLTAFKERETAQHYAETQRAMVEGQGQVDPAQVEADIRKEQLTSAIATGYKGELGDEQKAATTVSILRAYGWADEEIPEGLLVQAQPAAEIMTDPQTLEDFGMMLKPGGGGLNEGAQKALGDLITNMRNSGMDIVEILTRLLGDESAQ